ncbi:MAG: EAL domain-containing response regulator [Alphaproteobacteria bacterium]|nr:EAL domain-containing response regulator [Alphaproteobacteria bacterium]
MRMLVIDDEKDICDLIAELGGRHGLQVETTNNPENVRATLTGFKPDFIMLDLMMPGTDGVELLRLLAETAKNAKLCLISGSDARVLNSARRLGSAHGLEVVAALEKPLDMSVLTNLFDRIAAGGKGSPTTDLAQAIASGQFTLHYQPVIEMATRRVKGVEALARWSHPHRGMLLPDAFLEQVVNDGLMQALTDVVVQTSVRQASRWHQAGEDLTLSMNVTASTLLDLTLPDRIAELCAKHKVPPEKLILEVTETEAMRDVTRTMDVLLRMRIRNIGVAIDDFGTGHSSLRELQRMPFSEMKIDKGFVIDMAKNKDCEVIVKAVIDLAHNLGLKVIAEGVEDEAIWNLLQARGCDYAQGFYMGRPMPADKFDDWLKDWRSKTPK